MSSSAVFPKRQAAEEAEPPVPEISVEELKAKKDRGEKFVLLDVREPYEYDICQDSGIPSYSLGRVTLSYERAR